MSFNCKNVNTCNYVLIELIVKQGVDIVFLQEHWLFDCQVHQLNEISDLCIGRGKSVDTRDSILPVQMPRGYGRTAVLWKKQIDHLITALPDGGNRIQCVEMKGKELLFLISVYMPCKGIADNSVDFADAVDVTHKSTVARTVMCRQDGRGRFPVLLDDHSKCSTNSQRKSQLS